MAKPYPLENKPRNKCRKWLLSKSLGRDPATGKYPRKTKSFTGTWTEACHAQLEFENSVEAAPASDGRLTVKGYLDDWIAIRKASGSFAPKTIAKNEEHARVIDLNLGHARLSTLSPLQIERAYVEMRNGSSPSGRKLSGTYVNCIHRTFSTALNDAVDKGIIAANPCRRVHPPKVDTPEKRALTSSGISDLINHLGDNRNEVALLLCVMMGLRRGETVGLSWSDVDFDSRILWINHSFDDYGNLNAPKTAKSHRPLPLPDRVVAALSDLMFMQADEFARTREQLGTDTPMQTESTPVFSDALGQRMLPHSLSTWWRRNRSCYGLAGWTIHELRHSYLTELARQGVAPRVMQELAGHSNVSTTLSIYTHASMEDKRKAVKSIEEFIKESSRINPDVT